MAKIGKTSIRFALISTRHFGVWRPKVVIWTSIRFALISTRQTQKCMCVIMLALQSALRS